MEAGRDLRKTSEEIKFVSCLRLSSFERNQMQASPEGVSPAAAMCGESPAMAQSPAHRKPGGEAKEQNSGSRSIRLNRYPRHSKDRPSDGYGDWSPSEH